MLILLKYVIPCLNISNQILTVSNTTYQISTTLFHAEGMVNQEDFKNDACITFRHGKGCVVLADMEKVVIELLTILRHSFLGTD